MKNAKNNKPQQKEKKKPIVVIGQKISFHANRITLGNPVKGIVVDSYHGGFSVKLEHDIEGLVNVWYKNTERSFNYDGIFDLIIEKN